MSDAAIKLAILDDYQNLSQTLVDWSGVRSKGVEITVFRDTIHDETELVRRLQPYTIICTMRERTPFPATLISNLPNLKLITTTGGRNRSLPPSSPELLILTSKTAPQNQDSGSNTNEHFWALLLAACKNVVDGTRRIENGAGRLGGDVVWQAGTGLGLSGKTLGIIGLGRLGQQLLPVARAFGLKFIAWSPNLTEERVKPHGDDIALAPSLEYLMSTSDLITLQLVYSPKTHHIIGAKELGLMKKSAIFVNTSRGKLVDTEALVDVLRQRAIRHAALDVYEEEPLLTRNPFEGLTNVTLTPHMAYVEDQTMQIWWAETVENVESWLEDGGSRSKAAGRELGP